MVDERTLNVYRQDASKFVAAYEAYNAERLREFIQVYFHASGLTADVGCGSGRDAAWLQSKGYPVHAYDAVPEMLQEARRLHPGVSFALSELPSLEGLRAEAYDNVLCSGVLMHVPAERLIDACISLLRILREDGILVVSFRSSLGSSDREPDGRLFAEINPQRLIMLFESLGAECIYSDHNTDEHRPEIRWCTLSLKKSSSARTEGIFRIQEVLVRDKKTSTYKFALLRSLCSIARNESQCVEWQHSYVAVPLQRIAVWWVRFYWPLLMIDEPFPEIRGKKPLRFRDELRKLKTGRGKAGFEAPDLSAFLDQLESKTFSSDLAQQVELLMSKVIEAIVSGPAKHAGGESTPFFKVDRTRFDGNGGLVIPVAAWRDFVRFGHWIEDSLVVRWAQLTEELDENEGGRSFGECLDRLLAPVEHDRCTKEVRKSLADFPGLECVWTGVELTGSNFDVDHVLPFSVWKNNDIWNLLPAHSKVNKHTKSDLLPSRSLLQRREESIVCYWAFYRERYGSKFTSQMSRAIQDPKIASFDWQRAAMNGLIEVTERLARTCGLERFDC